MAAIYYHYFIVFALTLIVINFIINNILFKNIKNYRLPDCIIKSPPLISIMIPARNEEKNIRRILNSMIKQEYPNLEILVLDDNSTDSTAQIVKEFSAKDSRISLVKGKPLQKGWKGKCFACQQLSKLAKGDYFIFTDADTLHYPDSVSNSLAALIKNNLDVVSIIPRQIAVTFSERMTVRFIHLAIISFMPLILVKYTKSSFFSTAVGQFLMFKRDVYEKIGGFESVKNEILEDINISKQIKKCGFKIMIYDGSDSLFCRMYTNVYDVTRGFSRFIYEAFDCNFFMEAIAIFFILLIFMMPFILLPLGILFLGWPAHLITLNTIQIFLILFIKIVCAIRFKERVLDILFTPVSFAYMGLLAMNSFFRSRFGKGVIWKDRVYSSFRENDLDSIEEEESGRQRI